MRTTLGKMAGHALVAAAVALACQAQAQAAEIVLQHSAVDKLLAQALFKNNGRFDLRKGACFAYLDNASSELKEGRVWIRSHLSSKVGVDMGGQCMGAAFASWVVVSGRPATAGGTVRLDDLRVENVGDPTANLLLESGLLPALPRAVELDLTKSVREMLAGNGSQIQATVENLTIESAVVANDALAIRFDFRLMAR